MDIKRTCLFLGMIIMLFGCGFSQREGDLMPVPEREPAGTARIYPDTDAAPVLTFYWGENKTSTPNDATSIGAYGIWEGSGGGTFVAGGEPATEIELITTSGRNPVYALCAGTITAVQSDSGQYGVYVRYGSEYLVGYEHLVDLQTGVTTGVTVEKGTKLGYTATIGGGFWEIYVARRVSGNVARTVSPYDLFDSASKQVLDRIASDLSSSWVATADGTAGTGLSTKGSSWFDEVGAREAWADMYKFGYSGGDTAETFYTNAGMSWVLTP